MKRRILLLLLASFAVGCAHGPTADSKARHSAYDFERSAPKTHFPGGWNFTARMAEGEIPRWQAEPDGKGRVLNFHPASDAQRRTYNLAWTNAPVFHDGDISVRVRANSGVIDQGGGPIWRVQDADNYYLARYNPLETNLRLYHVVAGKRTQLADAPDIKIPAGQWFQIDVHHIGTKITVALDGKQCLAVEDNTIPQAGGIGVWSKADAASSFDDLKVEFAPGT